MSEKNEKTIFSNYTVLCIAVMFLVGIICGFIFKFTNSFPICIFISVVVGLIIGLILDNRKIK